MRTSICLNADVGEMPGPEGRDLDRTILDVVTRCNIACGGHAGDDVTMVSTIHAARARGVQIGAHPSYPDREGFGRARPNVDDVELKRSLFMQVRTLKAIARDRNSMVTHLKPHGSLYNDAAKNKTLAEMVVDVCLKTDIMELVGLPGSHLEGVARESGLVFVAEAFADRSYEHDGSLSPRSMDGAVIADDGKQLAQVVSLIENGSVIARTGETVPVPARTICLHGDTPGAARSAFLLKQALLQRGLSIEV